MRVSRLLATNFRGWAELDLVAKGDVLAVGEPRAGRTDLVVALTRVLDPRSTRANPLLTDIHQLSSPPQAAGGAPTTTAMTASQPPQVGPASGVETCDLPDDEPSQATDQPAPAAAGTDPSGPAATPVVVDRASNGEVELTLVDLGSDIEQELPGILEPLTTDETVDESGNASPTAPKGLRMTYRVSYDPAADVLSHVVYFPANSNPAIEQFARVPSALRQMLPAVFLNDARPLQLRAEGLLRRLLTEKDPDEVSDALRTLEHHIVDAAAGLSKTPVVAELLDAILSDTGPARRAGDRPLTAVDVQFLPDDGSLAGLLRALQPVLTLDGAGPLTLPNHGSTTTAVLSASEALILAGTTEGAVIIGDDFGEGLDGPSAEHLASALKSASDQVWLTTRRAEVARAFQVEDLVRLTRHGGVRAHHQVPPPANKKEVAVQRHVQSQLLPALTASTVGIVEGRHDLATYSAADRMSQATILPLAAHGIRLITADNGDGGGTSQIPRVATLAKALGFRVVALVDNDPAKKSSELISEIEEACDALVRLPETMAIERALLAGADATHLRTAAAVLPAFGQPDPTLGKTDDQLVATLTQTLHKNGLHEAFLSALVNESSGLPPVLQDALHQVAVAGESDYSGPSRIDLSFPPSAGAAGNGTASGQTTE